MPQKAVRLVGVGIYHLTGEYGRQLRFDDFMPEVKEQQDEKIRRALESLGQRYGLDFAGKLDKVFHGDTLYRTIEYMRRHAYTGKPMTFFRDPDGLPIEIHE